MIAREWKYQVLEFQHEGFIANLYETGIEDAYAKPDFLGAQIFCCTMTDQVEPPLAAYWGELESVNVFVRNDISRACSYPEDEVYGLESDLPAQHYREIGH